MAGVSRIVVLDFVVVPGDGPGTGRVGHLQLRVAFVQCVAIAEIVQAAGMEQRVGARQARGVRGCSVFVDVVAQEQNQVWGVVGHMAPSGVMAVFPALA